MVKIPKSLAAASDLYGVTKEKRLALQKQVDEIEADEKALKEHLINNIPKSDGVGAIGKLWQTKVVTDTVPRVEDWELFYAHIAKTRSKGGFALLNKAVNAKSVKEVWESGKKVPGVTTFTTVKLSLSKL